MRLRLARLALMTAVVVTAAVLAAPMLAHAFGPTVTPAVIFSEDFEGATAPTRLAVTSAISFNDSGTPLPGVAAWGRVLNTAGKAHSVTHGLWVAGAVPTSAAQTVPASLAWTVGTAWTKFGGKYPTGLVTNATFALPELVDYYSANVGYWYQMPSRGQEDDRSFTVAWVSNSYPDRWDYESIQPLTSSWVQRSYSLTDSGTVDPLGTANLSRVGGSIQFHFGDNNAYGESPATGEGPTIDDISVSGFKFGPVRHLSALAAAGSVTVSWTVPARSTAPAAPSEERPVAYRVWRAAEASPQSWVELTSVPTADTNFVDNAPLDGGAFYVVQAWDPVPGVGYGEVDVAHPAYAFINPPIPTTAIEVAGGAPDLTGAYTQLPTITVTRSAPAGHTEYRWDGGTWLSDNAQSFIVPSLAGTHTLEARSFNSLGYPQAPTQAREIVVRLPVTGPAPTTKVTVSGTKDSSGAYLTPVIAITRNIAGGTTVYWWDSGDVETTASSSFRVPGVVGVHTLHAYSVAAGVQETLTISATLTVKTKPTVGTPTVATSTGSTYIRHNKAFYVKGSIGPVHSGSTTVKLYLQRYYSGSYHPYKTYTVTIPAGTTSYKYKVTLSLTGKYRVRAYHADTLHYATYSSYRNFTVHT